MMVVTRGKLTFLLALCWLVIGMSGGSFYSPTTTRFSEVVYMAIWVVPGLLALPLVHAPCGGLVSLALMSVGPAERFVSFFVLFISSGFQHVHLHGAFNFALLVALVSVSRLPTSKECNLDHRHRNGG